MVFSCAQSGNDEHLLYARCRSLADAACTKAHTDFSLSKLLDFNDFLLIKLILTYIRVVNKCVRRLRNAKRVEIDL